MGGDGSGRFWLRSSSLRRETYHHARPGGSSFPLCRRPTGNTVLSVGAMHSWKHSRRPVPQYGPFVFSASGTDVVGVLGLRPCGLLAGFSQVHEGTEYLGGPDRPYKAHYSAGTAHT